MEAWLASHPVDAALVLTVKAHGDIAESVVAPPIDVETAWSSVQSRIASLSAPAVDQSARPLPELTVSRGGAGRGRPQHARHDTMAKSGGRWGWVAFAAAAAIVGMLSIREWQSSRGPLETAERVLATAVGVRDSVTLSDGTLVVLAPGSRLTIAASFDSGDRSVILDGAAFFDVPHDEAHPFTVRAAGAEIRDLGTSFTVKTDATGGVSVSVTNGVVTVRETSSPAPSAVELRAGDRGTVSAGIVAVSRGAVTEDEMAWRHGQLTYRDTPLTEVQADLKRWYGINLLVADSALSRLTVTMPVQQDSASVVSTIAALLGADAEQRGDTVILRSAGRTIP